MAGEVRAWRVTTDKGWDEVEVDATEVEWYRAHGAAVAPLYTLDTVADMLEEEASEGAGSDDFYEAKHAASLTVAARWLRSQVEAAGEEEAK